MPIRVILPAHLRTLAGVSGEVSLDLGPPVSPKAVIDALEARHPAIRGTVRDPATGKRRPLVRFYACEQDLSHEPLDTPLPERVASGEEPFMIVGSMAGG